MPTRLLILALLAAVAYPLLRIAGVEPALVVGVKPLAVAALAIGALRARHFLLGAALASHAIGDITIELGGILAGIGPFLVGHLLYLAALWPLLPRERGKTSPGRIFLVALLAGWAGFLVSLLLPRLDGALAAAVPVYAAALLAMASAAAVSRTSWIVPLGAVLYVASDSLLAIDAFVATNPAAQVAVWPTYVGGQVLLAVGILAATRKPAG